MKLVFCPKCGAENDANANFCRQCGNNLQAVNVQPAPASIPGLCQKCGTQNDARARFCRQCGNTLLGAAETAAAPAAVQATYTQPAYTYTPSVPGYMPGGIQYAGFWKRFIAIIIDGVLLYIVVFIVDLILAALILPSGRYNSLSDYTAALALYGLLSTLTSIVVNWLYFAGMESSTNQATLGKKAMGIIVTDLNGGRISFGKATIRHFSKFVSILILGIGYLMIGFTEKKQGLHDMIAGCLVIVKK
ncbi:MAG TPA: RDD family protein [Candidatus Methanoperedenaceae archaeon]|nr:RDD family protein [Candidatus Methanoperedenaceae archaeon]